MTGVLTVSPTTSPFPYAALATATYTQKAEVTFDESAAEISLDFSGSKVSGEDEIVRTLAKAAGLADDSAKVRKSKITTRCCKSSRESSYRLRLSLNSQRNSPQSLLSQR